MNACRIARPAVLRRIPLDRHAVCEASAGTGKTFALEHLVIALLLSERVTLDRILVVTFTEKATHELRVRIRAKLLELLSPNAPQPTQRQIDDGDFWTIDDGIRARLARALQAFDAATITTIHAFCQRVLYENAFASGRLFDEQQVDGRDAFARAMRDALRRAMTRGSRRTQWLEAALRSGWSIARVEKLLWDSAQSRGELRPLFDAEALDRALAAFPIDSARREDLQDEIRSWGVHSGRAKALVSRIRNIADAVNSAGAPPSAPMYIVSAEGTKLEYLLENLPLTKARPGQASRVCDAALELARCTPTFSSALAEALLPPVRDELARRKRDAGQYDFDDMLGLVDEALRSPRGHALGKAMRERWSHVLMDEFQDTDETQWSIFRRAFFERGDPSTVLCLVGDPKQSIYRFRGADVHTYVRARDEIIASGGAHVTLEQNYRATRALVDATNVVFDQTAATPVFTGSIAYAPVTCGRPTRELVDGVGRSLSPVHVFRICASPGASTLAIIGNRVAIEVRTITDPIRPFRFDGGEVGLGDIYVLTRNTREARAVGAALRAASVPYAFYKQDGLFQTDEAKEVRSLLVAIEDPTDRARRFAAWLTPFFGLPLSAIERVRDLPATHPLVARLHTWKALADARQFGRLFERVVADSGIVRREIFFGDGERELTNYLHIFELLLEHAHRSHATLRDLVCALSGLIDKTRMPLDLEGNVQRLESERRSVQIMTIHKAKGLEAPIVFVVGGFSSPPADEVRVYHEANQRLAWVGRVGDADLEARIKAEEREEDQRLMYVALTRAKGRLYLPYMVNDPASARGERVSSGARSLRGPYNAINRRMADIIKSGGPLFSVEDVCVSPEADADGSGERVVDWRPPAGLLGAVDERERYRELRQAHAGAVTTSYTRMKAEHGAMAIIASSMQPSPLGALDDAGDRAPALSPRGARASGVLLHDLLEKVPLVTFGAPGVSRSKERDFERWRTLVEIMTLFDEAAAAHSVPPSEREAAERLVWSAYTTAFALPTGGAIDGIASALAVAREMSFVFAVLEPNAAALRRALPDDAAIPSGPSCYVRGSIDLLFDHQGRTYFVDWKSDALASYASDAVGTHVRAHYQLQAQLYSLATIKLLGSTVREDYEQRFGGIIYCFLRGLGPPGGGSVVVASELGRLARVGCRARRRSAAPRGSSAVKYLSPSGTIKERFLSAGQKGGQPEDAVRMVELEDVEPAYLGWEIARCAPGLVPAEARALSSLAGACVVAVRSGSTRLSVDESQLRESLSTMGAEGASLRSFRFLPAHGAATRRTR